MLIRNNEGSCGDPIEVVGMSRAWAIGASLVKLEVDTGVAHGSVVDSWSKRRQNLEASGSAKVGEIDVLSGHATA